MIRGQKKFSFFFFFPSNFETKHFEVLLFLLCVGTL